MKVLVSTKKTQGQRKNDFCWVPEGELLMAGGLACDDETIDGDCGCLRSLCGIESHTATTTMKVVDSPLSVESLAHMIREARLRSGYSRYLIEDALDEAAYIYRATYRHPVGTIMERRGSRLQLRKVKGKKV